MDLGANFFTKKKVLVVDDFEPIRSSLKGMLAALGCNDIHVASTGQRATAMCKKTEFDFLLCDFNLGEGKDGYQLFEELKLNNLLKHDAVFIMVSAETKRQVIHGLVELQPDDYLLKPFSYRRLEHRLIRAFTKRVSMGRIYDYLQDAKYTDALEECQRVAINTPKYYAQATRFRGEILLKLDRPDVAETLYQGVLKVRQQPWAQLGLAISWFHQGKIKQAETLLLELAERNETRLEAYDWLAMIYVSRNKLSKAGEYVSLAVKLSPRNISRQRSRANLAVLEQDFDTACRSFKQISKSVRYSVHDDVVHHFNYARCLLDAAKGGNKLTLAKHINSINAVLKEAMKRFDHDDFLAQETVLMARIHIIKGEIGEAKALLKQVDKQAEDLSTDDDFLDCARAWFSVGEHQRSSALMEKLSVSEDGASMESLTTNLLLEKEKQQQQDSIDSLLELNEKGVELYRSGLYQAATDTFMDAYEVMPYNPVLALNLAQGMTKAWSARYSFNRIKEICLDCIKVIEASDMDEQNLKRYRAIKPELEELIRKRKQ